MPYFSANKSTKGFPFLRPKKPNPDAADRNDFKLSLTLESIYSVFFTASYRTPVSPWITNQILIPLFVFEGGFFALERGLQ